jgi:hypothetical protein
MKLVDLECQLFTSCTFNFLCFVCRHYHYNSSGLNIEFLRLKFKRLPFEFRAVTFRSIFTSNPVHLWFTSKNRCIIRLLYSISLWVTRVDVNLSVCMTDTDCEYAWKKIQNFHILTNFRHFSFSKRVRATEKGIDTVVFVSDIDTKFRIDWWSCLLFVVLWKNQVFYVVSSLM